MTSNNIVRRSHALFAGVFLCACSTDVVSIGEERTSQLLERGSRCAESTEIEGDVRVENQADLDALAGCEQIAGDLAIEIFETTDLAPLGSLRVVGGTLELGARPPAPIFDTLEEWEALRAEREARIDRMQEIADAGWLRSLHGVEALEQVGALDVSDISAPDLRAFSSLRNVSAHYGGPSAGQLIIARARELLDLSGLEALVGIRELWITGNPALESLVGVRLPTSLESVRVGGNPRLADLDPLRSIEDVEATFVLTDSAVRDLDALASLENVLESVEISDNPELVDASGLVTLSDTRSLTISGNAALTQLPEFASLFTLTQLYIQDNAALETFTLDSGGLALRELSLPDRLLPRSAELLAITGNDKLRSIALPNSFPVTSVLAIEGNPSLVSVDLGNLERVTELLTIVENAQLSQVQLGVLRNAGAVEVINNPRLETAALAGVPTFQSTFTGNADSPAP